MADTLHLTVVTPERALIDETVDQVQIPGFGGYLGVLPGHAPLFPSSRPAYSATRRVAKHDALRSFEDSSKYSTIPCEFSPMYPKSPEDIDAVRAAKARSRAEERIAGGDNDTDYGRAQAAVDRADTRLKVVGHKD